ncbi:MAG TPA: phosphotransferase [Candidatus Saccharimonadia bacterium]|nr:phosphotransferase [Candidatus Saccharimonadia bacterium]
MESKTVQPRSESEYRNLLQYDFPSLDIHTIRVLGSGEDRVAVLVNNAIVFRLPRNISGKADAGDMWSTEKEIGLLKTFQLPFDVPRPSHVAPDKRYFGYPFLAGNRWADVVGGQIPSDELLREWVKTRQVISRAVTISDAQKLGVPRFSVDKCVSVANQLADGGVATSVSRGLQEDADYLREHLGRDVWEFTHNDLNAENILIDKETNKITAVLDFGDAYIAPRSSDYYLWDKYPHQIMERITQIAHKEGDDFDVRIARALHRLYVADDIIEYRKLGQNKEAEQGYLLELERCYEIEQ